MKRLPSRPVQPVALHHQQRLVRWLHEWNIDRRLSAADPTPEPTTGTTYRPGQPVRYPVAEPLPQPPAVGQIRLLAPDQPASHARLWYVALLPAAAPQHMLVAPFGRFAEPAVPGEWLTGRTTPALRVLCLWNARECNATGLPRSWFVDTLSSAELEAAQTVWLAHGAAPMTPATIAWGTASPTGLTGLLAEQTGPPLVHPLDPRREYLEIDRVDFELALAAPPTAPASAFGPAANDSVALAAETIAPYGSTVSWNVEGLSLRLAVVRPASPTAPERVLRVLDEQSQPSTALDGAVLVAADRRPSAPVRAGSVTVPADWLAHLVALRDVTGREYPLRRRS